MKKFVPFKYILGMIALFFVIPMSFILLIVFEIGFNDLTIAITMFLVALILSGPIAYYYNQGNASIVIENNSITNDLNDGTLNFGWTEEIQNIKKIELVTRSEAQKYYKNCRSKKVLLIDFGSYNVKYIPMDLFTRCQIKRIIKEIKKQL